MNRTHILIGVVIIRIGYIRVSSESQSVDRQKQLLEKVEIDKYYIEKVSGRNRNRDQLNEMIDFVREGDTVVVESISRLARNTKDFLEIVNNLTESGVEVISLKEQIDTSTVQGRFICTIFGALYELERESIKERQREGIETAKIKGIQFGRPPIEVDDKFKREYQKWVSGKQTAAQSFRNLGISKSSFYRKVKEMEDEKQIETTQ
ncbi:recombinase family protein [Alkalibacillus salilacus]|uniref:DNA invertase Pin-like site-specific DNA recombinase n=1 Tax=Alkalibacillus salilacus TaxID=284582 RepID=A0ABT9VIE9_9BACI|nr:recombinase family protein [Alkalibacillus salilacus]MDQ0160735.1 DNA invertase Pin-like site-specific DNA recombinase [Alkalibacillus salilacus]